MKPEIINLGPMKIAGFSFYGDPVATHGGWTEENEIGVLWNRFKVFLKKNEMNVDTYLISQFGYELHIWNDETQKTGHYEVFVGKETKNPDKVPIDLVLKNLPLQKYALFEVAGPDINRDIFAKVLLEWLPAADLKQVGHYMINRYDQRYKGLEYLNESVFEILFPIE